MTDFKILRQMVDELNSTNSTNDKKDILSKYKDNEFLKKVLYYTYNPTFQYYVTPENLEKNYEDDLGSLYPFIDLFEMLDILRKREVTGHKAINSVNDFCFKNEDYKDLIYKIIGKDLEIRMGDSLINKVIPDLIPTFDCALATDFDKVPVDFAKDQWIASRKLDGVRCLAVIDEFGKATLWSRQGNQFETLGKVVDEVESLGLKDMVLDGEICLTDANGNEDFQGIMKQIRKKDHTIETPKLFVFDYLTIEEFDNHKGTTSLLQRLHNGYDNLPESINSDRLDFLPQERIISEEQFTEMAKDAELNGFEGIMVRKNIGYEGTRSHNLLKVKKFHDAEYTVLECVNGTIRWTENGQQVEKECLSSIIIEHKGCKVSVGSGFSKEQREYYLRHHDELVGKTITVQYFEETQNQTGGYSLRFPVIKHIFQNGRDC